jgi:hypothetical protein
MKNWKIRKNTRGNYKMSGEKIISNFDSFDREKIKFEEIGSYVHV